MYVSLYMLLSQRTTNQQNGMCAKRKISLGTSPVWSESLLCIHWVAKDRSWLNAEREDSDQTGRMPRLIWVFAWRTSRIIGFVVSLLIRYILFLCASMVKFELDICFNWKLLLIRVVGKVLSDTCAQRRFRSACAFAQSDQNLHWVHFG